MVKAKTLGAPGPETLWREMPGPGRGSSESAFMQSLPLSPRPIKLQAQCVRSPGSQVKVTVREGRAGAPDRDRSPELRGGACSRLGLSDVPNLQKV